MKNKGIGIILIVAVLAIAGAVIWNVVSLKLDKRAENPYEYNVDVFKEVNPDLIHYKEVKQIRLKAHNPSSIDYINGKLFIAGDSAVRIIDTAGNQQNIIQFNDAVKVVKAISNTQFIICFKNSFQHYDLNTKQSTYKITESDTSVFTSLAINDTAIFIADAGKRKVYSYSLTGEKTGEFGGISGSASLHGFIIPSPYFDLNFNEQGELWVVNPGMHSLQNYSFAGNLEKEWSKISMKIDGFCGCCNPAHFAFLPDGNFVTSEKGMVRIKVYNVNGDLLSVVAAPKKFTEDGKAPDITVSENGQIIALDFDKKVIRFFDEL
ncbi:hypothetical protein OAO55_03285 [Bacteroidales bacterium]|nr:hypothetical protein [Bacteroidales bacterium]